MPKRDDAAYKITKAADMIVGALPPLDQHPGAFIKDVLLPEYGLSATQAAEAIKVQRVGFQNVLKGKHAVSRELAYKLGALMRDEVADLLIAYQQRYDLEQERDQREAYKASIARVAPAAAA